MSTRVIVELDVEDDYEDPSDDTGLTEDGYVILVALLQDAGFGVADVHRGGVA